MARGSSRKGIPNMTTEIIVHGHGAIQATFDRHLPFWEAHGHLITVFSLTDDPLNPRGHNHIKFGTRGRGGPKAHERNLNWLSYMAKKQFDRFLIYEYDAFSLDPNVTVPKGLSGNIFPCYDSFIALRYPGHPMGIDSHSAFKMLEVAKEYPEMTEGGHIDRYYGALAQLAGVPLFPWIPAGYCQNSITIEFISQAIEAVKNGARMIHGVKDERTLKALVGALP